MLQYRNSTHSATGKAPAVIMHGGLLKSPLTKLSNTSIGNEVWITKYNDKDKLWEPATVVYHEGNKIVNVETTDGFIEKEAH